MDFGKKINELRKKNNVTQEELAAELGVTAAAVSKWENNYTLPDILMLCAIADYFQVTTDELLGRNKNWKYAVIAAETPELGEKIKALAKTYGVIGVKTFFSFQEAHAEACAGQNTCQILAGFRKSIPSEETDAVKEPLKLCQSIGDTDDQILKGMEMYFQHFL